MLTIKTHQMTITRNDNKILNIVPQSDEIHIKFPDNVEMTIPMRVDVRMSSVLQIVMQSKAENITIDFTSPNIISFS